MALHQLELLDFILILQDRWLFILILFSLVVVYIATLGGRRFLAIVGILLLFQMMWEAIDSLRAAFPFFSLEYTSPDYVDFYIMSFPASAVFLKVLVPMSSSYIFTSMATRKLIDSKIDMVKDRGKKVVAHMSTRFLGSGVYVLMLVIIEPVIAAGDDWALGPYEMFYNDIYFGVDPFYFLGAFITSSISFFVAGIFESRIGYDKKEVFFDYEGIIQGASVHHVAGSTILSASALVFSFIALFLNVVMGMIDILIVIPCIFTIFLLLSYYSGEREEINVGHFCDEHPDSFLCFYDS